MDFDVEKQRKQMSHRRRQETVLRGKSGLHLAVSISFKKKKNSSWSSQTKAPGIKRNWDRALEHAAIVQEINEAEERLLGMPGSITGAWPSIP